MAVSVPKPSVRTSEATAAEAGLEGDVGDLQHEPRDHSVARRDAQHAALAQVLQQPRATHSIVLRLGAVPVVAGGSAAPPASSAIISARILVIRRSRSRSKSS